MRRHLAWLLVSLLAISCGSPDSAGGGFSLAFARAALDGPCPEVPDDNTNPPTLDKIRVVLFRSDGTKQFARDVDVSKGMPSSIGGIPSGTNLTLSVTGFVGGQAVYQGFAENVSVLSGKKIAVQVYLTLLNAVSCAHGTLHSPRAFLAAAKMKDGRVLLAGGIGTVQAGACNGCQDMTASSAVDVFDPGTGSIFPAARLNHERALASATLLPNGNVLVVGGASKATASPGGFPLKVADADLVPSFEVYQPDQDSWIEKPMASGRIFHTATPLPDGRVLVAGGGTGFSSALGSALLYDPSKESVGDFDDQVLLMAGARLAHRALPVSGGRVMLLGGATGSSSPEAEVYDPSAATNPFTPQNFTGEPSNLFFHDAMIIPLRPDEVLVTGGSLFDGVGSLQAPSQETVRILSLSRSDSAKGEPMGSAHLMHTMLSLRDDNVLLAGGFTDLLLAPGATLETFDPATSKFSAPQAGGQDSTLSVPRGGYSALPIAGGRALIVGGLGPDGLLSSAEIFTAASKE